MVETIAMDPEVGAIYKGVVTRLMNFGAFVEIDVYKRQRRISLATNFSQSSTIQRTGLSESPESAAFSLAQATIPLEASTWQTEAPAFAQAKVCLLYTSRCV